MTCAYRRTELEAEIAALEQQLADGDLERKRLVEQADQLRSRLTGYEHTAGKIKHATSNLHALASQLQEDS